MCIHCEALSSCASLTYMSFPGIVAKIKKMTKTLTHICPYETYFGWKTAQIIADAMKYNTYVTYLRLGNNIGDGGAEALVRMLENNTTLKVLDLSDNSSITLMLLFYAYDSIMPTHSLIVKRIVDDTVRMMNFK